MELAGLATIGSPVAANLGGGSWVPGGPSVTSERPWLGCQGVWRFLNFRMSGRANYLCQKRMARAETAARWSVRGGLRVRSVEAASGGGFGW